MDTVKKEWIWLLITAIVIGVAIYYFFFRNQTATANSPLATTPVDGTTCILASGANGVYLNGVCISSAVVTPPNSTPANATTVPAPVTAGNIVATNNQIVWNWNVSPLATGYDVNTSANTATVPPAIDNGVNNYYTQTGLTPSTSYTIYVWAYNAIGQSTVTALTQTTAATAAPSVAPSAPTAATNVPSSTQIVWNWTPNTGAGLINGYVVGTTNVLSSATDNSTNTTYTETGLTPNTPYSLYVWAYNTNGVSPMTTLTQSTTT